MPGGNGRRYEYDRETDILTIVLSDDEPDFGKQAENIIAHYTKDGTPVEIEAPGSSPGPRADECKLVQIEILDASSTVLELIRPILARSRDPASA